MSYRIGPTRDTVLDARIDVDGSSVILHSRGGATGGRPPRNTQYEAALSLICKRALHNREYIERVLIDSAPARRLTEAQRLLLDHDEIVGMDDATLASTIRSRLLRFGQAPGVTGGNSTKQVRIDFRLPHSSVVQSLALRKWDEQTNWADGRAEVERLSTAEQRKVTPLHIRQAVDRLLSGEDAPNFADSRDYDVIVNDGQRLAPKKVFGLALEAALGIEAFPAHFSAGWSQPCFELLQEAGYRIVEKDDAVVAKPPSTGPDIEIPVDPDELRWAEGDVRVVQHLRTERRRDPKATAEKRNHIRALHDGRLACENVACVTDWYEVFPTALAESVFEIHHTVPISEMTEGHETALKDLICLCASCHRAEHRKLALGA